MSERPGFGDLLRQRVQGQPQAVISQGQPVGQQQTPQDPLTRRYWLYAELYRVGDAKDREFVRSAVSIDELAQVVRAVMPNDPRAIALEYVVRGRGDVPGLLRELMQEGQVPEWLRTLMSIALGGEGGKD